MPAPLKTAHASLQLVYCLQVRALALDRNIPEALAVNTPMLPALACLEAVTRNMELVISWFAMSSQSAQAVSVTLHQLLETGKFCVHLPSSSASAHQKPFLSCTYLSNLSHDTVAAELAISSDGLSEFVSKLYLSHHQELNLADFDARIDIFLGCYKV